MKIKYKIIKIILIFIINFYFFKIKKELLYELNNNNNIPKIFLYFQLYIIKKNILKEVQVAYKNKQ